jgi:serine/threonine-protein kinase RsbW
MGTLLFQKTFPSDKAQRKDVVDTIFEVLGTTGLKTHSSYASGEYYLALDEAVTNAMEHGNSWDPANKIEVTISEEDSNIIVAIKDQGEGFDIKSVEKKLKNRDIMSQRGRGIYIIRQFANIKWNRKGNIAYLSFPRLEVKV